MSYVKIQNGYSEFSTLYLMITECINIRTFYYHITTERNIFCVIFEFNVLMTLFYYYFYNYSSLTIFKTSIRNPYVKI